MKGGFMHEKTASISREIASNVAVFRQCRVFNPAT